MRQGIRYLPAYPLLEGWDFSHAKPAVIWAQWVAHVGALHILGGVQGFSLFLELFAPKVLQIRARWFPDAVDILSYCDPAGASNTSGTRVTGVSTLQDHGVYPRYETTWNQYTERDAAIQALAGYMFRVGGDGAPSFKVNPRCVEVRRARSGELEERRNDLITTALQVGYVWDDDHAPSQSAPNVRRPKKNWPGDNFSHLMNGLEYVVLGEKLVHRPTDRVMERERRRLQRLGADTALDVSLDRGLPHPNALLLKLDRIAAENRRNRDRDPDDERIRGGLDEVHSRSRGGYPATLGRRI